jgi:hypothetical protein
MFNPWPILRAGLAIWVAATLAIRLIGHRLLLPANIPFTLALYAVSFLLMAVLARQILTLMRAEPHSWPRAAVLLVLPTLLLDPFSCLFFTTVFPAVDPEAAGIFGGWMLVCCGGALIGTSIRR